jgi:cell division septation protein DedD
MNDQGRREDASVRIVGREFIIIIVVVFSSLSFALGFFVGKNNAEKKADYVVQAAAKPVDAEQPQTPAASQLQPANPERRPLNEEAPVQDKKTVQQTESGNGGGKPGIEHREAVSDLPKGAKKREAGESAETIGKSDSKPGGNETTYTVQLGALKNAAEARRLKTKYVKKGYKIYITASKDKQKEKIFKVRSGEFKEKKDAEIFALRLKKNEGLAAFVTVSND